MLNENQIKEIVIEVTKNIALLIGACEGTNDYLQAYHWKTYLDGFIDGVNTVSDGYLEEDKIGLDIGELFSEEISKERSRTEERKLSSKK